MEHSRTPLLKWAKAIQFLSEPVSINAVQLAERIRVTYKTAWLMLNKIRRAISEIDNTRALAGSVTVGLAYYGTPYFHSAVRHPKQHPMLIGAAFSGLRSYVKIKQVSLEHMDGKAIHPRGLDAFISKQVRKTNTDIKVIKRIRYRDTSGLWSIFHRAQHWINRTFHGIGIKYLQSYWDEYCFRAHLLSCGVSVSKTFLSICMKTETPI
jgi:hypothetical protein